MSVPPFSVLVGIRALHSWQHVMEAYPAPFFRWKEHAGEGGQGRYAYAVLSGNREIGEVWALMVMESCKAPSHVHTPNERYGELVVVIDGELIDVTDDGQPIVLGKGGVLVHNKFRAHAPFARFAVVLFHQPRGSKLLADLPADLRTALEGSD